MDRYFEQFIVSEQDALRELARVRKEFGESGHYPVDGGFVVWANRDTREEEEEE